MKKLGVVALVLFILTAWAANYAVAKWGTVSVGFGLAAPAGVYFAGLAFGLRDAIQRNLGRLAVVGAILGGAALSLLTGTDATLPGGHVSIATAGAIAFLLSETLDFAVYTPLSRRLTLAVAASNLVGAVVDSIVFLTLAFSSLAYFWGQVVGKLWMTLPVLLAIKAWQYRKELVPA